MVRSYGFRPPRLTLKPYVSQSTVAGAVKAGEAGAVKAGEAGAARTASTVARTAAFPSRRSLDFQPDWPARIGGATLPGGAGFDQVGLRNNPRLSRPPP